MEFNQRLREERLRQGFSLEEVEEETKIRKYYLDALENGNFRVLPPPVYACGFVKRYAILLGLDEKEMVDEFRALAYGKEEEPVEEEPVEVIPREPRKPLPIKNIKNITAGIVFLIVALWLGSYLVSYIANWSKNHTSEQPKIQQNQAAPQNQTSNQTPPQQTAPPEQTQPPAANNQSGITVDLEATARCWLSITVDGKPTFTGTLIAGDKKSFNGKKSVVVNAGNSGGIKITVNGQLQPILGATGEHKIKEYKAGQ